MAEYSDKAVNRIDPGADAAAGPHEFRRRGWRFWICNHCFAPKSLHPRHAYVTARPLGENYYLAPDAPHFREGW